MLPDRVSNPGPLTYESGALPIALRGPAPNLVMDLQGTYYFELSGNAALKLLINGTLLEINLLYCPVSNRKVIS